MSNFPDSSQAIKNLALDLIKFLRSNIKDTNHRKEWSERNFTLLREFATAHGVDSYPQRDEEPHRNQFLWDFIGYVKNRGILIAAESEHSTEIKEIQHDFEKLLYVRSPLKLMLCRINGEPEAREICHSLEKYARDCCSEFSPAEVFIIYCVYWADDQGKNRDVAFMLQLNGEPHHQPIRTEKFEQILG